MNNKEERILKIFWDFLRGQDVRLVNLSKRFNVSTRTIARDIESLKCMLADDRELFRNAEITYDCQKRAYEMTIADLLKPEEMLVIAEILIGSRGLPKKELLEIVEKLRKHVSCIDENVLAKWMQKELFEYQEVIHDTENLTSNLWRLAVMIENKNLITVTYIKINKEQIKRKIFPEAIVFSEYYFYLAAHDIETDSMKFFRVDRITDVVVHREVYEGNININEGKLRNQIQYMWKGDQNRIKFEYTGPSINAILDKIPTAEIISKNEHGYIVEAEVLGDSILFFLLSQGEWIKVLEPQCLVEKMRLVVDRMHKYYFPEKA